ncbi:hypothetical protein JIG36_31950 [Actinoplanes sp. LDG1-06]|uniref:Uncharacterized protein n=1 Tax=Paractinoplanes ovalisporus TaxID=2810368 RepID=A0ABS2ALA2_9ACTN|nr:hypothetical protein [Actinoplanes ovalisporus]MBM2620138.1 hypothetical protein [Actinoplanes ovalisporus]
MRKRSKVTAFVAVTAAAIAALFIASSTTGAVASSQVAPAPQLNADQLKSVLIPAAKQPATSSITKQFTLAEAMAAKQFEAGPGLTSSPAGCLTMTDALGDLSKITGSLQSGERAASVAPNSLQRYFLTAVFHIPGGADKALDNVAKVISTCTKGTINLDTGKGAVKAGSISYKTHAAKANVGGAKSLNTTLTTTFLTPATGKGITANTVPVETQCEAEVVVAAVGDNLLWSVEPTASLSTTAVNTMFSNLQAIS